MTTMNETLRRRTAAVALLAVIAGVGVLSVAMYQKAFTTTETVTVQADRAGLQMRAGTIIKYRGVDVGKVKSAKPTSDGKAVIEMAMFPDMLDEIPADVEVSLEQLTAFGNKGVVLRPRGDGPTPAGDATEVLQARRNGESLQPGDVLTADHIAVEANQIFDRLDSVLTTLEPAKVNAVLTGLSTMVEGKGDRLGRSLETADRYLAQINTDMPALERDWDRGADVLDIYSDASGDLLGALGNITTTANTLTDVQPKFSGMLDSVTSFAEQGTLFTAANKDQLDSVLATSTRTTSLLAAYAPQVQCTIELGGQNVRKSLYAYAKEQTSLMATVSVLPTAGVSYKYPQDLPDVSMSLGPRCWDYPDFQGQYLPAGYDAKIDPGISDDTFHFMDEELSLNGTPLSFYILGDLSRYINLPGTAGGGE